MLAAYKKNVILAYQKKKEKGPLSNNLISPSPGKLRDECLIVYRERYDPKDDEILRLFFSSKTGENNYSKSIENFNIDELRPLVYLLNGRVRQPSDKIISLLAWLINFEPRPYTFGETGDGWDDEPDDDGLKKPGGKKVKEGNDTTGAKAKSLGKILMELLSRYIPRSIALATTLVLFTSGGTYIWWVNKNKQCMYWAGDHYQAIDCDQTVNAAIIPFNEKTAGLRKITRPDTLTRNALGNVWYTKIRVDSVEFYTDSGAYPLDNNKRLLPVTFYMLNKYVFAKKLQQ